MDFLSLVTALVVVTSLCYLYLKRIFSYWKSRGVPNIDNPHYFYGNCKEEIQRNASMGDMHTRLYRYAKSKGYKHIGVYIFFARIYMPIDLDLIKMILQRDFNHFMNHGVFVVNEDIDPLSGNLFNLEDEKWRALRVKLTPTFTSGKLKMMFKTLVNCTKGLEEIVRDHSNLRDPMDIKDIVSRFTTDVVGSCAFGIECNSFKDVNSDFLRYGNKFFEPERLRTTLLFLLPKYLLRLLGIKATPNDVTDFFMNIVKSTVEYREKNNISRKDFMHLLLQLKNKGRITDDEPTSVEADKEQMITTEELAAQCFVFFAAGFETSATTMTFALLELALNQDVQEKLREDITSTLAKHNGQTTYEAVMNMTYLNKVVYETLRKHPPAPALPRICTKDYKIPGTDSIIEKGTRVHITIQGIHHDPEYYPDPEKFDPERFNEENKAKRPPFSFLTFGEGPRICIGARFGMMQVKVGLITIIKEFKITLNEKTKIPFKYETKSFINSVKGGVWLNATKIE